jgi:hypothetical protein
MAWATAKAADLRRFDPAGAGATATSGDLAPTVQFLRIYAGPASSFTQTAEKLLSGKEPAWSVPHDMAAVLEQWVSFKRAGLVSDPPFEVRARVEAATDLMEQVQQLLDDASPGRAHRSRWGRT